MTEEQHMGVEHPGKPFSLIFCVEMWERFGYYGLQALLVVFLSSYLGFSDTKSNILFGAFAALVYAFISVGGYIGDKVLGTKRTMFMGAVVLAIGYGLLGFNPDNMLYIALGFIIAGNMLFKANPSSLVAKLYKSNDPRIDGAFTIYYMAINIGSFISMLLCPIIKEHWGWSAAFWVCCAGLVIACLNYIIFQSILKDVGSEPDFKKFPVIKFIYVIIITLVVAFVSAWLLEHLLMAYLLLGVAFVVVIILLIKILMQCETSKERTNLLICIILIAQAIIFFILYQQMPTSLNFFAMRNVEHYVFGIPLQGESFQTLNPFWILIASPLLAWFYTKMGKKGKDFCLPTKFAFGMFLCSLGFLTIPFAVSFFAGANSKINGNWLVIVYGFQSIGELLISGLGLAMVTKLVPKKIVGFMMGVWFMSSAIAMALGGLVATLASVPKDSVGDPSISLGIYSDLFLKLGITAMIISIIMFLFVPKLKKYIT